MPELICIEWEDDQGGSFLREIHKISSIQEWKSFDDQWVDIRAIYTVDDNNDIDSVIQHWHDNEDLVDRWSFLHVLQGDEQDEILAALKVKDLEGWDETETDSEEIALLEKFFNQ